MSPPPCLLQVVNGVLTLLTSLGMPLPLYLPWPGGQRRPFLPPLACPHLPPYRPWQVVNGVLLPCVAALLLICLNHEEVMGAAGPQSMLLNGVMVPCVGITVLLASVVLLKQSLGRIVGEYGHKVAMITAIPVALLVLAVIVRRAMRGRRATNRDARAAAAASVVEVTLSEPPC